MGRCRALISALLTVGALGTATGPARAVVVERVVAVVGDRPILLSELRDRAKPFIEQIASKVPPGAQQAAAESQMLRELLDRIVDEELLQQAADRAHVNVTEAELDRAFDGVASSQGVTVQQLFAEALSRSGLNERAYRDEIRRQLLEGKMLQLRVKGRLRITEEDLKGAYDRALREERRRLDYHPAWIVLRVLPGSSSEATSERRALAQELSDRASRGEDFSVLAQTYSDDSATRATGGDLGVRAVQGSPGALSGVRPVMSSALEETLLELEPGGVSGPLKAGDALVVLKLLSRGNSRFTSYASAKDELTQRLQAELLERSKKRWLEELKQRTHLDVRL